MKTEKRIAVWFKKLGTRDKIMAAAALVMTVAVLVAAPTVAWFSYQRRMATMAKINSPAKISLRSGAGEDIIQFKMSGIDTSKGNKKDFVFCVEGEDISKYNIQLAHTTNINFEYTIYKAKPTENTNAVEYEKEDRTKVYYEKDGSALKGDYVNDKAASFNASRKLGSADYEDPSYKTSDIRQSFAEPLYWQTDPSVDAQLSGYDELPDDADAFRNYYILEVTWGSDVSNDKETDLIYLTAQVA